MSAGKNLKLAVLWTKDGYNLNIDLWNKMAKIKIWPPKKGDFKNGGRRPDKEQNIPIQILHDLFHIGNEISKKDVGTGISKVYRMRDKTNNGAWNNILIYGITKEAGPNYMYKLSLHFCQDDTAFDFFFTKPEMIVSTAGEPDIEKESRTAMLNFLAQFQPGILSINMQLSVGEGGPFDPNAAANGNGGSGKSESKYSGSSEEDIGY